MISVSTTTNVQVVVVEGPKRRIMAVVNYLTLEGLDSSMIEFQCHQTNGDIEILEIIEHRGPADTEILERRIVAEWSDASRIAYRIFREKMTIQIDNLDVEAKRDRISFSIVSRSGRVFVCSYMPQKKCDAVELRRSSLRKVVDFDEVIAGLESDMTRNGEIELVPDKRNQTHYIRFLPTQENADTVAASLVGHIVSKIKSILQDSVRV